MNEIPTRYNPKEVEDKWYRLWEENKLFAAKPNLSKKPFCIVIPPPNITGILHMGHALNNTIQDILIRYHRMKGEETLWMPGTDHAGIATQNVVEKEIAKEGLRRQDLGREKFLERVWLWKEQYGSAIMRQLKKLGASCDWLRTRFTMDEEYSRAVKEVFVWLWNKGLIYQDDKVINWCPRCQTALSDEEAPHQEIEGNLYYLRYPFKGLSPKGTVPYIVVATTRPETMLGDTAVAVNPKDKRYKKFIGKILILPLLNREIKIIADTMVDMKFGTGAVKVTPAHDPNDYILGKKHHLDFINIMHPDGRLNEFAGKYKDADRFKAREAVLEDLKKQDLLEKSQSHKLSAGHCYRCSTLIEPYLSKQWFVKMKPLAKPAIDVVKKGKIKFYPKRWTKVYLNWMQNLQDWCISRQIWWGHRLPIYYCKDCLKQVSKSTVNSQQSTEKTKSMDGGLWTMDKKGIIVSIVKPEKCPICNSTDIYQDEDVLDTWFSSWLWPFATFYWPESKGLSPQGTVPEEDLEYFYPTSVLVTAPEIIFFWVARMIMAGLEFMGDIPFKDVYIHGTVRDIEGKKMSKSLGNIIDPLDIIEHVGADALRFSLISITSQGQDVFLSEEKFQTGRNFANKIWNASRFIMMNLDHKTDLCEFFKKEDLSLTNRWILSRFYSILKEINKSLDTYRFNEAVNTLYGFFWHEFCDWYLEMIKLDIKSPHHQVIMYKVLEKSLRIAHPFMPFITEEIWQRIHEQGQSPSGTVPAKNSIVVEPWPHLQEQMVDKKIESKMDTIFRIITEIRNTRHELRLSTQEYINAIISTPNKTNRELINSMSLNIKRLSKLNNLDIRQDFIPLKSTVSTLVKDIHISILLEGIVDLEKERENLRERKIRLESEIESKKNILSNKEFIKKAPPDIVGKEKYKLQELKEALERLKIIEDGLL